MVAGATFLIEYPHTIIPPEEFVVCNITVGTTQYAMRCPIDCDRKTFSLYDGLNLVPIPEGSTIVITLSPITNPSTPQSVSSFRLTSFSDYTQNYLVDQIPNNLVPQYQC